MPDVWMCALLGEMIRSFESFARGKTIMAHRSHSQEAIRGVSTSFRRKTLTQGAHATVTTNIGPQFDAPWNEVLSSKPKTTEAKNYRVKRSANVVEWKEGVCTLGTHVEACAPSSSAPSDARLPELVVTLSLFVVVQDLFSGKSFQSKNTTSTREWSESEAVKRQQQTWSKHTCRVCCRYVLVHTEVVIWPYTRMSRP